VELPFTEAVSVTGTVWLLVTVAAVAVNFTVVALAGTVADAGTVTEELLEEIVTAEPPVGAAADKVIEQVEVPPEARAVGEQVSAVTVSGLAATVTVTAADIVVPLKEAPTLAV
jgi:hypothetical protein